MLKVLGGLKGFLKREEVIIDGPVFRFHNVFTAVLLFACSVVVTATQYVGKPIMCIVGDGVPDKPINTYCWVTSTFTMPAAFGREVGSQVAHPGVANEYQFQQVDAGGGPARKYYTYYQWVCFVLFFQGLACHFPKLVWENCEGGLMKTLVMGLNHYVYTEDEKRKKKEAIIDYVMRHLKVIFIGNRRIKVVRYTAFSIGTQRNP